MQLRQEAAKRRLSLAALVREKVGAKTKQGRVNVLRLSTRLDATGEELGKKLREFNATTVIRQMREEER